MGKHIKKSVVERIREIHGDIFDLSRVGTPKMKDKIEVKCKIHGWVTKTPNSLIYSKSGCYHCGMEKSNQAKVRYLEEVLEDAVNVHGDLYDYSLIVDYVNKEIEVPIVCKKHGVFQQKMTNHNQGTGCPKCAREVLIASRAIDVEKVLQEMKEVHNNFYDYSKTVFRVTTDEPIIICPIHGEFKQKVITHTKGHGCNKCAIKRTVLQMVDTEEKWIEKAKLAHKNYYSYVNIGFVENEDVKVSITCPKHGIFQQRKSSHVIGKGCKRCAFTESNKEVELKEFISNYISVESGNRKILSGFELDVYSEELKTAFEFNGIYFHSDKFLDNKYHLTKTKKCDNLDIRLIHIFEDEWDFKKDIVKSRIKNIINKTENKIYARKCEVREISSKDSRKFLDQNHIQGNVNSKIKLGLYYQEELVSLMTLGGLRKNLGNTKKEGHFEILRFCNKLDTSVIGGASKLYKYFERTFKPEEVISYADRRWSKGELYCNLGFKLEKETEPNYYYIKTAIRENRFKYRKDILIKEGYDATKTEKQIMKERGFHRIYDCGTFKFTKTY